MLLKKMLSSFLLLFTLFAILVSSTRVETLATALTIQTNFLSSSRWFNASGTEVVGNTITGSPYRILTNSNNYLLSVGSNDTGSSRVLFGATSKTLADEYADFDHPNLSPFISLSRNHSFEGVIAQLDHLSYSRVTSVQLSWGSGSTADSYVSNLIYSLDQATTWQTLGSNQTITPGSSAGSFTFNEPIQSSYLNVGIFLTNNVNLNTIYIQNPELTITYTLLTDSEQANQFASEIEDYSPCATVVNNMIQITSTKKDDFIDKYTKLSSNAKNLLNGIAMGDGFNALDRYQYLISFTY